MRIYKLIVTIFIIIATGVGGSMMIDYMFTKFEELIDFNGEEEDNER